MPKIKKFSNKKYLIKKDTFEGVISIDNYDFTLDIPMAPTGFYDSHANLIYQNMHSLSLLICTPDFDKLLITVDEPIDGNSKS